MRNIIAIIIAGVIGLLLGFFAPGLVSANWWQMAVAAAVAAAIYSVPLEFRLWRWVVGLSVIGLIVGLAASNQSSVGFWVDVIASAFGIAGISHFLLLFVEAMFDSDHLVDDLK